jgi:hypothetical protein
MTNRDRARALALVRAWDRAGAFLATERTARLRSMTKGEAAEISVRLLSLGGSGRKSRSTTSGLVRQQELFQKLRAR